MDVAREADKEAQNYERLNSDLLAWIRKTIESLNDRHFANSLPGVQQQLGQFNTYRTVEKPPKFVEKGNLEMALFAIASKLRAHDLRAYVPPQGKTIADINKAWESLERAEHERELALREELIRSVLYSFLWSLTSLFVFVFHSGMQGGVVCGRLWRALVYRGPWGND